MKPRFQGDYDFNHDIVAGVIRREIERAFTWACAPGRRAPHDGHVIFPRH